MLMSLPCSAPEVYSINANLNASPLLSLLSNELPQEPEEVAYVNWQLTSGFGFQFPSPLEREKVLEHLPRFTLLLLRNLGTAKQAQLQFLSCNHWFHSSVQVPNGCILSFSFGEKVVRSDGKI